MAWHDHSAASYSNVTVTVWPGGSDRALRKRMRKRLGEKGETDENRCENQFCSLCVRFSPKIRKKRRSSAK